jgi:hypothetical protein
MGDVINNDLTFHDETEKQEWTNESLKWRLPYWDWAAPGNDNLVHFPELYKNKEILIRRPAALPEPVPNPLYRYELKVGGVVTKMGELPPPFKIIDVDQKGGPFLPVCTVRPVSLYVLTLIQLVVSVFGHQQVCHH